MCLAAAAADASLAPWANYASLSPCAPNATTSLAAQLWNFDAAAATLCLMQAPSLCLSPLYPGSALGNPLVLRSLSDLTPPTVGDSWVMVGSSAGGTQLQLKGYSDACIKKADPGWSNSNSLQLGACDATADNVFSLQGATATRACHGVQLCVANHNCCAVCDTIAVQSGVCTVHA